MHERFYIFLLTVRIEYVIKNYCGGHGNADL
jgi:hypothetical protein